MIADFLEKSICELTGYGLFLTGIIMILVIQIVYYLRLIFFKRKGNNQTENPISIIVFVHNEESRIESYVKMLLQLDYSEFEVIIVDMFSEDNTLTILNALERKYPNLKARNIKEGVRFTEKMAANIALKAATYDWCVFLSPNYEKISPSYLKIINSGIAEDSTHIMNYCNYLPDKSGLLCRVERFFAFFSSAAYSISGMSLFYQQMNVTFKRQMYFDVDGFRGFLNLEFANMELIFNQFRRVKTELTISSETSLWETEQAGSSRFGELVKKRLSILRRLRWKKKIAIGLPNVAILLVVIGIGLLLFNNVNYWAYFLIPLAILFVLQLVIIKIFQNQINEKGIFFPSMIYLIIKPFINLYYSFKSR